MRFLRSSLAEDQIEVRNRLSYSGTNDRLSLATIDVNGHISEGSGESYLNRGIFGIAENPSHLAKK